MSLLTIKYSLTILTGMYFGSKIMHWINKNNLPQPITIDSVDEEMK